ncbi:Uncharacterized protein HZ326_9968 [Fusarium oxysporum f. sp. albedinis]|nr:Uncharacterized protein HZ326_9968 [Fusarium oxysporum f. sp. albedinis]
MLTKADNPVVFVRLVSSHGSWIGSRMPMSQFDSQALFAPSQRQQRLTIPVRSQDVMIHYAKLISYFTVFIHHLTRHPKHPGLNVGQCFALCQCTPGTLSSKLG